MRLEQAGGSKGLRTVVCKTLNTNVDAISFYRSVGYEFHAIDISFYSNHDVERGEVALFMKKALQ